MRYIVVKYQSPSLILSSLDDVSLFLFSSTVLILVLMYYLNKTIYLAYVVCMCAA
jgi:hypothetical protein